MYLGLNISHLSRFPQAALADFAAAGGASVRFPLWRGSERSARRRFDSARADGLTPLPVLDRRSFTTAQWERDHRASLVRAMQRWASLFPDLDVIQVGNEPDGTGDSSSSQSKDRWFELLAAAGAVWPCPIIAGGLTLIDYSYLDGIGATGVSAVAVHPYGTWPSDVPSIVRQAHERSGLPVWVTEIGAQHDYYGDESVRARWHSDMLATMAAARVQTACVYCGMDDQGPFGLLDGDGNAYESWAAVLNAAPAVA